MNTFDTDSIATRAGEGRALWFLDNLAIVRSPRVDGTAPVVIELLIPSGGSPPLHVHQELDDGFLLLAGELAVQCGDARFRAGPCDYVALPSGVPHTFRVTSREPGHMLLIHADDSFLRFMEAVGQPAVERTMPTVLPAVELEDLTRAMTDHGMTAVGPSMPVDLALDIVASNR
jgi:mannose-6-phosphate isomerase-like protein (cupin superfamily)